MGGVHDAGEVIFAHVVHIPYAHVIFDRQAADATRLAHQYPVVVGIRYCGRYGDCVSISSDESVMSGERAAAGMLTDKGL